eukprot:g4975.t1
MPPKEKTKEQKAAEKAAKEKRSKAAEDKTFGLKNKNKSKVVQQKVNQIKSSATAHDRSNRPKDENAEKQKKEKAQQQQALLAGLFNMAVDKKGRAFDPTAKKKAKEKNMEDERSGKEVPEEIQKAFVEGIKNAIRMQNAKGTNLSQIGGSVYVKDVLSDPKYEKALKNEDVDAANAEDDRDMFVILEEKRQPYFGDTTLKRVDMAFLKAWWLESARLELRRDPDTGEIRDEPIQAKAKAAAKKTGEQLYKENPNIFKHGGATAENDGADSVSTAVGATPDVSAKGDGEGDHRDLRTREDDADSDEDGLERDENVPVGKAWGESDDIAKLESEKAAETEKWAVKSPKPKANPLAEIASSSSKPPTEAAYKEKFDKVLDDLPEDLGELESVSEEEK